MHKENKSTTATTNLHNSPLNETVKKLKSKIMKLL